MVASPSIKLSVRRRFFEFFLVVVYGVLWGIFCVLLGAMSHATVRLFLIGWKCLNDL